MTKKHYSPSLDDVVSPANRRPSITVGGSNCPFLQQAHQFSHGIGNHHLCITLHQDIQFRVLARLGLLACGVEAALCGDGGAGGFEDLGDVGAVGDGPACFFCKTKID